MIKVNNKEVKITKFPNNELHVDIEILNMNENIIIEFQFNDNDDILALIFCINHIQNDCDMDIEKIIIKYMPYSRMDRKQNDNCFTLNHLTKLLNSITRVDTKIHIVEPHSDVCIDLLKAKSIFVTPELVEIIKSKNLINAICFPDKGAKSRYTKLEYFKNHYLPIFYCEKIRDFNTGNITGLEIVDMPKCENVLIVDDLCSKGTTFLKTAEKLKENGVNNIYLAVAHLEKNVLNGELIKKDSPINMIYATDSMNNQDDFYLYDDYKNKEIKTNIEIFKLDDLKCYKNIKNLESEVL